MASVGHVGWVLPVGEGMGLGFISLTTEVPGPRSREVMDRLRRYVPKGVSVQAPVAVAAASGALVTDVDGNTYIDLTGGIGVLNVGHAPDPVVRAVRDQTGRFLHTDFTIAPYDVYVRLAQRLAEAAPGPGPKKACFFNSGAEAVENAVKFARLATGRQAVIAFEGAFHGRTLMALSLTSKPRPYKEGMGPFAPEVYRVPFAYCYRCPLRLEYPGCGVACAEALDRAFSTMVSPSDTAAVIVEPVQGEGGFVVPPPEFLPRIEEICRRHGVLLIADEIQTGFYRTGRRFACERFGLAPDLVTVAKSLAAGLPLSGVVGRAEVMDAAREGNIGGTYVGNPVACAAALAALDIMEGEDLARRAEELGRFLADRCRAMQEKYALVGDVRALGAMVGMELVLDRATKEPATRETAQVLQECLRRGVLVPRCGLYGNVIRFLNPLTMPREQLAEALDVIEGVVAEVDAAVRQAGGGAGT